jgi:hypothetical protein
MLGGRGGMVMVVVRGLGGFMVMVLVSFMSVPLLVVVLSLSLWVGFFGLPGGVAVAVTRKWRRALLLFLGKL